MADRSVRSGTPLRAALVLLSWVLSVSVVSCVLPEEEIPDADPHHWTFDADVEGWSLVLYDAASVNSISTLSWTAAEGSPGAGCLKIVAPFTTAWQYVSVIAPIVADPFDSGIDLTGKKLIARVRSEVPFGVGGAVIFSNTGDTMVPGDSGLALLGDTGWKTLVLDFSEPTVPGYDPTDMRFLGVIFATRDQDPADGDYTFYVDTCLIDDAP